MADHMAQETANRRGFQRIGLRVEGRLVFAGVDTECLVHEMSAAGAIIETLSPPALNIDVALDVPGIGFARGHSVRYLEDNLVCLALNTTQAMQARFADRLIVAAIHFPPD